MGARAVAADEQLDVKPDPAEVSRLAASMRGYALDGAFASSAAVLALQRQAGNRATVAALNRSAVRRQNGDRRLARCPGCGGRCHVAGKDDEFTDDLNRRLQRVAADRAGGNGGGSRIVLGEIPFASGIDPSAWLSPRTTKLMLQRDDAPSADTTALDPTQEQAAKLSANQSRDTDQSKLGDGPYVTETQARAIVSDYIAALGPLGAKTFPFPPDLVASADPSPAPSVSVQTWPAQRMLMRSSSAFKLEAGFVGALQLCYDLCSGDLSVNGWVWAGGGVASKGLFGGESWWGAYVFAEKEFGKWHLDFMPLLNCGTCEPKCASQDDGKTDYGAGIAGFPIVLKPGEKKSLKQAGIEVGALITPRIGRCSADLELVVLIDLTKYLGPVGAAVKSGQDLLNKWAKEAGEEIDCGVGAVISGTLHLCKSVPGGGIAGITSDSALLCGGGYVGCALGLSHDKASLPGGGH